MRLQMLKESEGREADRRAREEDRQFFRDAITAAVTGIANAFAPKKKRRFEYSDSD